MRCVQLQFIGYVQAGPTQKLPNESASQVGELDSISSFLPDDLLVEILSERLQVTTHHNVYSHYKATHKII